MYFVTNSCAPIKTGGKSDRVLQPDLLIRERGFVFGLVYLFIFFAYVRVCLCVFSRAFCKPGSESGA